MTHDEAFLQNIAARPEDDAPRLIYADWLEEHGDPARAELIRVQVALAQCSDGKGALPAAAVARLAARERALLSRHKERCLRPLRDLKAEGRVHGELTRGFVEDVVIDAAIFAERGDELWGLSPVGTLHLTGVSRLARRLSRCPHLSRVRRLSLAGKPPITPGALRELLASPHLSGLQHLSLEGAPLRDADIEALAAVPDWPALRGLSLEATRITGATLPALLARLGTLEALSLSFNKAFDGRRFAASLAALSPDHLRQIHFFHTPLGTAGLRALAEARRFTGLTELWLRGCSFDAASVEALAGATHLTNVTKLYLGDDFLSDEGGIALAAWPGLRAVRTLDLDHCRIGPRGGAALASSPHLGPLAELRLRDGRIGDAGVEALAANESLAGLHALGLPQNEITAAGARALAASPHLARLRHFELDENAVGDEGAAALAESPSLRSLRWLTVDGNGVRRASARRLIARLPDLTVFSADGGFLTAENLAAVREGLAAGGSEDDVNAAVEERLVQAILDDPDDMKARDVYARFLQSLDCPWWVVIYLQRPDEGVPDEVMQRWRGWFEAGRAHWLATLLPWATLFGDAESFDRGFLRRVWFDKPLPDAAAQELARFPPLALLPLEVQRGNMTGEGAFRVLARRACLARTTRLDFRSISAAELAHVLGSPHLTGLEELSFGPCSLGDEAARLLAASPASAGLRLLDFGRPAAPGGDAANNVGPDGLAALGTSPHLSRLRSLGLAGNGPVGDAGVRVLLAAAHLRGLAALDLRSTGLTVAGVLALAGSPWSSSLRALRLGGSDALGDDALEALAASPHLAGLRELGACGFRHATDAGARALAASKSLRALRSLHVSGWAGLTEGGTAALRERYGAGFL